MLKHINSYYYSNRLHEALVRKLAEAGYRQHVFLPTAKSTTKANPVVENVSFSVPRCFSKLDRLLWPLKMHKIWNEFKKDRRDYPAQLHHAHTLFVNGLIAYWAKKRYGTPYIVTIRNTDVNQFLKKHPIIFRRLGLKIMREAEAVVTLSNVYWEQSLRSYYKESEIRPLDAKHHTIPNGCEDFWFENRAAPRVLRQRLRLVFVGLLAQNKNLRTVLVACRLLKQRGIDFDLKVVGTGPFEAEFKEEAKDLPVTFLGYVNDRPQLLEIYRDSDLLVVPSFTESFGVVYAEAMSQSLPVIYTTGQGFDGFFSAGKVGYAVDPHDAQQIADRILAVKNNYAHFTANAVENSTRFKWSHSVSALIKIYREAS